MHVDLVKSQQRPLLLSLKTSLSIQPVFALAVFAILLASMPPSLLPRPRSTTQSIKDASGQTVQLVPPARRVVMFAPVLWDYLALGGDERSLVAVTEALREEVSGSLLDKAFPSIDGLPAVVTRGARSAHPSDAEDVMRYDPDAVLSWDWLSESLTQADLPVVKLALNAKTRGDEPHAADIINFRVMGSLTGHRDRAEELISTYRAAIERVSRLAGEARATAGKAERAMFLSVRGGGQLYLEAPPFLGGRALVAARAEAKDFRPSGIFSAEQLLIWDPDVIIINCCYGDGTSPAYFYDDPRFAGISAVRNRRIYRSPAGVGRMENMIEWPLLVSWLAEVLYPDHMPHTTRSDLGKLYIGLYGYRPTPADLDAMLATKENARSRDYSLVGRGDN